MNRFVYMIFIGIGTAFLNTSSTPSQKITLKETFYCSIFSIFEYTKNNITQKTFAVLTPFNSNKSKKTLAVENIKNGLAEQKNKEYINFLLTLSSYKKISDKLRYIENQEAHQSFYYHQLKKLNNTSYIHHTFSRKKRTSTQHNKLVIHELYNTTDRHNNFHAPQTKPSQPIDLINQKIKRKKRLSYTMLHKMIEEKSNTCIEKINPFIIQESPQLKKISISEFNRIKLTHPSQHAANILQLFNHK